MVLKALKRLQEQEFRDFCQKVKSSEKGLALRLEALFEVLTSTLKSAKIVNVGKNKKNFKQQKVAIPTAKRLC